MDGIRCGEPDCPEGMSTEAIVEMANITGGPLAGRELVRDIKSVQSDWDDKLLGLRSDAAARRVAVLAIAHPALNYEVVARELAVAPATALRALETLVSREVLRRANSNRRNRIWLAEPVLRSLDDFAARAGRRRVAGKPTKT